MLLSASATLNGRRDVCCVIGLQSIALVQSTCIRPNLHYQVRGRQKDTIQETAKLLLEEECGLVYCNTRADTKMVTAKLQTANINCKPYHGGLSTGLRKELQSLWINGSVSTLVCTSTFGMGIDKPKVTIIIHYSIPASIEEYYQESGRGGRNGCSCKCMLFFSRNDKTFHLREIHDYCSLCNKPITVEKGEDILQHLVFKDILREVPPAKGVKNRNVLYIDFGCFYMNVLSKEMIVIC